MVVWKPDWKSLFMVENVLYSKCPPSHVTTIWIPDTQLSGIQMIGIKIVTVPYCDCNHPKSGRRNTGFIKICDFLVCGIWMSTLVICVVYFDQRTHAHTRGIQTKMKKLSCTRVVHVEKSTKTTKFQMGLATLLLKGPVTFCKQNFKYSIFYCFKVEKVCKVGK